MKKLFTIVTVAGIFTFVACGPSAEQKAAQEKAKDSIADVEAVNVAKTKAISDSTSAYLAAEQAKIAASAAEAEELAKSSKPTHKTKETTKSKEKKPAEIKPTEQPKRVRSGKTQ